MVFFQLQVAGLFHRDGLNFIQLPDKVVIEQGINDLVDILDRGIVHTAAAPGLRVQSTFKYGTENSGADAAPVEVLTCFRQQ